MRLIAKYPKLFFELTVYFSTLIRFVLNVLLIIICFALAVGVFKSGLDLAHSLHQPLEVILQHMLLDIVFIVALVEVSITILGYLKDGSVHVRYIVDTVLIIMLNEVVSLWFKKPTLEQAAGIALILATLAGVRISTVRFGPRDQA
jgi:uncharacterized membrane protein (DUF373 family)